MKLLATAIAILVGWSCWPCASETVGHKPRLETQAEIENSFPKLERMLSSIDGESTLTLYEGLPHQKLDREQLAFELKNKKSITRYGFPFYETPNPVSEADTKLLSVALKVPTAFVKYQGLKMCGGFHPDFALVWAREGKIAVEIHVCFGCHEVKAYADGAEVYCDIKGALPGIKEVLKAYQIQRPDPKPFGLEDQPEKEGEQGGADQADTAAGGEAKGNTKSKQQPKPRPK